MEEKEKDKIVNIAVEDILPNRFQPRLNFDEKELMELSNSILKYGVIQPIVLRQIGEKYEIIAGERRYKATVMAGLKTIPAIINNTDDNTSAEIALLENLQRTDLSVIEEAQSFKKLMNKGFTQEEIASKLGISQSSIANKIRLLSLPKKVQDALLYNKISERHARCLLSIDNSETQLDLLDRIISERMTVRQTEQEISKILNKGTQEDNIPEEIKRIINVEPTRNKPIEIKYNEPIINYDEPKIEVKEKQEEIPQVIEIDNPETDRLVINPFQERFENSIRKINEEISNKEESYYDDIINNDMQKTKFNFIDLGDEDENPEPVQEIKEEIRRAYVPDEKIPRIISELRDFVESVGAGDAIKTTEIDLEDKYQVIIEINKKEVN